MFEFWAYGNAPDGSFSALTFGYAYGTIPVLNYSTLEGIMLNWVIEQPNEVPESWNVLPL